MRFSVQMREEDSATIINLNDNIGNCEAEVYSFGALLNAFSVLINNVKINVVDGFTSPADAKENITNGFKSVKLSPFVCRMNKGKYSFNNQHYTINKFYLGDSAIHGLLYNAPFTVVSHYAGNEKAYVTLAHEYNNKEEGFPFSYNIEITYELNSEKKLSLITKVINTGMEDMPLSDGWHPYFRLGETINDLELTFNSKQIVEFNEQLIPSGKLFPYEEFKSFKLLNDTFLDNCFVLRETDTIVCSLRDKSARLQLNIIPASSYPYLQIYTPPHRKSIAIENLSSAPDAFNNQMGLIIAKPGEAFTFTTACQVVLL